MPSVVRFCNRLALATAALSALACAPACAALVTIRFETAPPEFLTAPVSESGFTYSSASGSLYVSPNGNPGQDMEGDGSGNGGVLRLVSNMADSTFQFAGLDFSAYNLAAGTPGTITVVGLLGGATVGTDTYTLPAVSTFPYTNWTAEQAATLSGQLVDTLLINLPGSATGDAFYDNVDNVRLEATSLPEPASLKLLAAGLLGLVLLHRRAASRAGQR